MSNLTSYLFKTDAFRVCEENKPFWYTSSKIGPYFVNGHFLYGSEKDANVLLDFINDELENASKEQIPQDIFSKVLYQYENNVLYSTIINNLVMYIKENISIDDIDYISGGERRDWYFSNIMAYLLNKPHITIYKDLTTIESKSDFSESKIVSEIKGKKFLHLADLLNQSASFTRAWIPAIKNLGSNIVWSIFAVDRMQGGTETLTNDGVKVLSLLQIDESLFTTAKELGIINHKQLEMLKNFKKDPDGSMKEFLINHPEFIENAKKSDNPRTVKRVNTLIELKILYVLIYKKGRLVFFLHKKGASQPRSSDIKCAIAMIHVPNRNIIRMMPAPPAIPPKQCNTKNKNLINKVSHGLAGVWKKEIIPAIKPTRAPKANDAPMKLSESVILLIFLFSRFTC